MRFQSYFAASLSLTLLAIGRDAGAQGTCQQEADFAPTGSVCPVLVSQADCARLVEDNKADWKIDRSLPVCLGRGETLASTGHAAHSRQCNRYFTDHHNACHNRAMMVCAYRGMFGRGLVWVDDDPVEIYRNHQVRQFAYAEVVFMKNVLCRLPERNKIYLSAEATAAPRQGVADEHGRGYAAPRGTR